MMSLNSYEMMKEDVDEKILAKVAKQSVLDPGKRLGARYAKYEQMINVGDLYKNIVTASSSKGKRHLAPEETEMDVKSHNSSSKSASVSFPKGRDSSKPGSSEGKQMSLPADVNSVGSSIDVVKPNSSENKNVDKQVPIIINVDLLDSAGAVLKHSDSGYDQIPVNHSKSCELMMAKYRDDKQLPAPINARNFLSPYDALRHEFGGGDYIRRSISPEIAVANTAGGIPDDLSSSSFYSMAFPDAVPPLELQDMRNGPWLDDVDVEDRQMRGQNRRRRVCRHRRPLMRQVRPQFHCLGKYIYICLLVIFLISYAGIYYVLHHYKKI